MKANFCIIPHLSKTESLWRGFALRPNSFYQNDDFENLSHRVILHSCLIFSPFYQEKGQKKKVMQWFFGLMHKS
jgi:hypothetical protein